MVDSSSKQRSYSVKTIKILYANAAGRCSKCHRPIIIGENKSTQIGQIAHIYPFGESNSPRYSEIQQDNFPTELKNDESNLILLCPSCHSEIDAAPENFSAKKLIQMKREHTDWINKQLSEEILNITYAELEVICKAIANCASDYSENPDYSTIKIEEKITKNELSHKIYNLIQQGMLKTKFVAAYLSNQTNATFAEDLLNCIKSIYKEEAQKYKGDDLFLAILDRMHAGIEHDFTLQAAGIAVLTYFFHICEIFEK
ncbi:MAG: HNH endonuclease [Alphaproteobacteria bacterium]|nr:HNH endonuclease [Alphaproteobacteria bacterium]